MVRTNTFAGLSQPDSEIAFRFFHDVAAPKLVNFGSHYFWNRLVLQISHQDESIKHLVLAASTIHRNRCSTDWPSTGTAIFNFHYGKALQLLSHAANPDSGVILTACLLFVLCDEFQQNKFAALQHIIAGREILAGYYKQRHRSQCSSAIEELGPIFQRLQLQIGELDQETMPHQIRWPYITQSFAPGVKPDLPRPDFQHQPGLVFQGCHDLETAWNSLQRLASSCMNPQPGSRPPVSQFHEVPNVTMQLNQWFSYFDLLCSRLDAKEVAAQRVGIHLLRLCHLALSIMSRCAPFDDETLYDEYLGQFEHLMLKATYMLTKPNTKDLAEKVLCPLFFTAAHYRDVTIRRRAVAEIQRCGWEGVRLATIAEQLIHVEEKGCENAIVAADIPERNRIRVLGVSFLPSQSHADDPNGTLCDLAYSVSPYASPSSIRKHRFKWDDVGDQAVQASISQLLQRVLNFEFTSLPADDIWNWDQSQAL